MRLTCNKSSWNTNSCAWKTYCKSISFLLKENENTFLRFWLDWFVSCLLGYFLLTICVSVLQFLVIWTSVIYVFLAEENLCSTVCQKNCLRRSIFYDLKELFMPDKHQVRVYVARWSSRDHWRSSIKKGEQARSFQILYLHWKWKIK